MLLKLRKFATRFRRDERGQFAVIIGLFGLPLLLICGYAIDISHAVSKKGNISSALDAAALAAVIPANMSVGAREDFAREVFEKNYFGDVPVSLDVEASRERVKIIGTSHVNTLIGGLAGMDRVDVQEDAEAILTRADIVCVLALDPTGERAIEFLDYAKFNSPACSVQVNSTNILAMVSDVLDPPIAKSFCVGGISRGEFSPYVKHACSVLPDPYKDLPVPDDGECVDVGKLKGENTAVQTMSLLDGLITEDVIGDNAVLEPGTYCKGLEVKGLNIRFNPGTYIIKKDLKFKEFAGAIGENVTFIFKGDKAKLKIEGGSQVNLKAPSLGTYAGLVFFQTLEKKLGKQAKLPSAKSEIKSGGGLRIVGTAYFPTQELMITSDSPVVSQSPATSFIAYRLKFAGKSVTEVHVDHEAGGIPPLLPRSDDGARLVQ